MARLNRNHIHSYNHAAYQIIVYFLHRINIPHSDAGIRRVTNLALREAKRWLRKIKRCPAERMINARLIVIKVRGLSELNETLRKN